MQKIFERRRAFLDLESEFVYISSPNSIHHDQISKAITQRNL